MNNNEILKEIWKDIEGYEGLYQISNFGKVKSLSKKLKWGNQTYFSKEKFLKESLLSNYYIVYLYNDKKRKTKQIHRLVAIAFISNPENKPCVNHKDGNKQNNNVNNLEWVTHKENTEHAIKTGLFNVKGENNPTSKITNNIVIKIKKFIEQGLSVEKISKKLNISKNIIINIKYGNQWKHINIGENNE